MIKIVCPSCGSDNITSDAVARWNYAAQDWELSSTFDDKFCGDCDYEGPEKDFQEAEETGQPRPEIITDPEAF